MGLSFSYMLNNSFSTAAASLIARLFQLFRWCGRSNEIWAEKKKKQATSLKKCTSLRLDITIIRGLETAQTLLEKASSAGGLSRNSWARLVASLRPCLYDSSGQKNSWIWVKQFCCKFQMKLFQLHYSSRKTKPTTAKNDSVDKFLNGQKREHLSLTRDLRNRASFHQRQTVLQSVTDFALFRVNGLLM